MNFEQIKFSIENSIAWIKLNRPEKRNSLNDSLIIELTNAIIYSNKNSETKAVILTGEGNSFCSGADLEYLQKMSTFSLDQNKEDSKKLMKLYQLIYEIRKPTIAMVNGPALAGGCGLATVCDFIIASKENAKFGYPEVKIGFIPAIVMIFLIKRVGEGRARELILSGKVIDAIYAKEISLINEYIEHEKLIEFTTKFVKELLVNNSINAIGLCKEMISNFGNLDFKRSLEYAANMNAAARMTEDCKKGVKAFLNKEKPRW